MSLLGQPKFLGFSAVEDLCAEEFRDRTVYLTSLTTEQGSGVLTKKTKSILVEADLGHAIGYVSIPVGSFSTIHGLSPDPEVAGQVERRARSLAPGCVRPLAPVPAISRRRGDVRSPS
jgi:hypothetical protein